MTGVEKIKDRILGDASLQAGNILKQAEKDALNIIHEGERDAEQKRTSIIVKAHQDAAERKKRLIANASLDARKMKLAAKQEMINETLEKALKRLNSLPVDEYKELLAGMILQLVETWNEEIILSTHDKSRLGNDLDKIVNERLALRGIRATVKVSDNTANINGGFILKNGDIEINNSFGSIIKMYREELEEIAVKELFGNG